jgi:hypothetical protein
MKHVREYWASFNPEMTIRETPLDDVVLFEPGDEVLKLNVFALENVALDTLYEATPHSFSTQFARIGEIDYVEGELQTYNLKSVAGLHLLC